MAGLLIFVNALLMLQTVLSGTFCTQCWEDFSGLMTMKGAGGGAIIAISSPTARNEPASGYRIDFRSAAVVNGFPSWSWTGTGELMLNVFLPQSGLGTSSPGTIAGRMASRLAVGATRKCT